jgi:integrase
VPLSDAAIAVLEHARPLALQRNGEPDPGAPVFPGLRRALPLSNMAMTSVLRRMGRGELTVHGFRSSLSDWCTEQTSFSSEAREMALAHAIGDKVEAAYRRGDLFAKRRELIDSWGRHCTVPVRDDGRVVALRRQAAGE